MLLIRSGVVVSEGRAVEADVLVDGGRIEAIGRGLTAAGVESIDASGCWVTPGFIDLQLNGAFGIDLTTEPTGVATVAAGLPRYGVTAFCPTVISCGANRRGAALAGLSALNTGGTAAPGAARVLGVHLEGPFLNPVRRGAHPASALVAPDRDVASGWTREGEVALVTMACELPGALDVVRSLVDSGVVVSCGHSDASAEELEAAAGAGVTYVTHLFNAMRPFGHRDPGIIGAALVDERLTCGLIADGIHVHPTAVRMAWRALGPERVSLVTDAVAVLGAVGGRARVGDVDLVATDGGVREPGGALAGTDLSLDQAVRNLVRWTGCSVPEAIGTVTSVPARLLGLTGQGVVREGANADLLVLDAELRVVATVVGGQVVGGSMAG